MTPQERLELREELMEFRDDANTEDSSMADVTDEEIDSIIQIVEKVLD